MTPTNAQIIAEAERRWLEEYRANGGRLSPHSSKEIHVINIMREGWKPPAPVDPDVEAYWRWHKSVNPTGRLILNVADAYLAGASMAREQERERSKGLVEFVGNRRLCGCQPQAQALLAKYQGEA